MKMFLKNVEAFDLKRRNVLLQMSRRFSNTCPQKKKIRRDVAGEAGRLQDSCHPVSSETEHLTPR